MTLNIIFVLVNCSDRQWNNTTTRLRSYPASLNNGNLSVNKVMHNESAAAACHVTYVEDQLRKKLLLKVGKSHGFLKFEHCTLKG